MSSLPATKPATKPTTKPATKPATKPTTKPTTKPAIKAPTPTPTSKPVAPVPGSQPVSPLPVSLNTLDLAGFTNLCVVALQIRQTQPAAYPKHLATLTDPALRAAIGSFVNQNINTPVLTKQGNGGGPLSAVIAAIPNASLRQSIAAVLGNGNGNGSKQGINPAVLIAATYADPLFPVSASDPTQKWQRSAAKTMADLGPAAGTVSSVELADTAMLLSLAFAKPQQGNYASLLGLVHDREIRKQLDTVVRAASQADLNPHTASGGQPFNGLLWKRFQAELGQTLALNK